jgi:hypothetical protein
MADVIQSDNPEAMKALKALLVGKSVTAADFEAGTLALSDGTVLAFDRSNSECCSWIQLTELATCDNVITSVGEECEDIQSDDDDYGNAPYRAWIYVVTTADEIVRIAEAEGEAGNGGYYLSGFALDVTVMPPA